MEWTEMAEGVSRQILGHDKQIMMVKVKFEAGAVGVEGLLIRRNLLPMAIVGGIVGIIGLILVYTVGQGMI